MTVLHKSSTVAGIKATWTQKMWVGWLIMH